MLSAPIVALDELQQGDTYPGTGYRVVVEHTQPPGRQAPQAGLDSFGELTEKYS
eukprot:SAG31_NODE_43965_length_265_cov_0.506024_1_plen_54_part_10